MALYYPWMHFQDTDWLKLALLSWERIVRLRPHTVDDRDSEVVRAIRGESDLLREVTPSRHDLETVADAFFELLGCEDLVWELNTLRLQAANPTLSVSEDLFPPPSQRVTEHEHHPALLWIYCGGTGTKMSSTLRRQLLEAGLAVQVDRRDPWVGLHPRLGAVYLTALADTVARHNALSPVTDDPRMHHAVGALDRLADLLNLSVTPALHDTRAAYVHLSLRAVIRPERIAAVPVSRLVAFRQRHAPELAAFYAHVDSLATELGQIATVENLDLAHAHLQALYERATKPQLDELRRALRAFGVESTVGTLGLKVDLGAVSGTALGALAVTAGQPAIGAGAVALTVVPYIAGRLKALRQQRTDSPVAYLLAAEHIPRRPRLRFPV
ncbi:DUF6236 family protein [Streptomyces sp. NPDC048361]|uniref:DUF6236 family protein n=1 Tax=Streptomyces sp. NPDC048361 TaxID=3154720 RepID=UPI003421E0C0